MLRQVRGFNPRILMSITYHDRIIPSVGFLQNDYVPDLKVTNRGLLRTWVEALEISAIWLRFTWYGPFGSGVDNGRAFV
jgi:hypothetical protein